MVGGDYVGLEIHRAARIASSAHGGQVVLSDATRALVETSLPEGVTLLDLGEDRLKDLARPERIWQLRVDGLPSQFPPLKSLDAIPNNLPLQLTSFVGRDKELAEGRRLPEGTRLLTLTGPGGTGKTRLSIQIAAEASEAFKNGVYFIALAPVTDPELVPSAIADALSIEVGAQGPAARVLDVLSSMEMLLVLDNFEQILPAGEFVSEILKAAPRVKVIASSRAALRLYGEQEFPVPPLGVPDPSALPPLDSLSQYAAVELFIERAVALKPGFEVNNDNAPAVAGITALVDGLPLAIELAAARIKVLPPAAILQRLETRLGELGGGARDLPARQQTLRSAIAWSFDMLDDGSKLLFARISVFVRCGGLNQIEAVCAPEGEADFDALTELETLVEQNLVRTVEAVEPRFFMLHVIREYALEQLAQMSDAEAVRRRHAEAFLDMVEAAAPELMGDRQKEWLDRLEADHDNVRAALELYVATDDGPRASRMVASVWRFWQKRGYLHEGRQRVEEVLAMPSLQSPTADRYKALEVAGGIAYWRMDQERASTYYHEALGIARAMDDKAAIAEAAYNALFPDIVNGGADAASQALGREAAALFEQLNDVAGVAKVRWALSIIPFYTAPPDWLSSIEPGIEARDAFRQIDDRFGLSWSLYTLGLAQMLSGSSIDDGEVSLRESLEMFKEIEDWSGVALCLSGFATLAFLRGDEERAVQLIGARTALVAATDVALAEETLDTPLESEIEALVTKYPQAHARGATLDATAAAAFALGEETPANIPRRPVGA